MGAESPGFKFLLDHEAQWITFDQSLYLLAQPASQDCCEATTETEQQSMLLWAHGRKTRIKCTKTRATIKNKSKTLKWNDSLSVIGKLARQYIPFSSQRFVAVRARPYFVEWKTHVWLPASPCNYIRHRILCVWVCKPDSNNTILTQTDFPLLFCLSVRRYAV